MLRVGLFSGGDLTFFTETFDYYVGVDRGSLFLLEQGLPLDLAVGDFDSVTADELSDIKKAAGQIYQSPSEKNDTDTELALKRIFQQFEDAEVTVFGALGGRADHSLSNIFLPSDPDLAPFMERIVLRISKMWCVISLLADTRFLKKKTAVIFRLYQKALLI